MIKYTRFFLTLLFSAVIVFAANAQSTTSSPYSRFGLGDIDPQLMPQNLGLGGIGVATNKISLFNNINVINPASYGAINLTVIDVGVYTNFSSLSQTGQSSQTSSNFRLSHVAFGIPVTKHSALSFGLLPYSERGFNYSKSVSKLGNGTGIDTNTTNYNYSGDGGLSKSYIGYGFGIGKHLLLGGNVSYIFGNLKDISTVETPGLAGFVNTRTEKSNAIGGLNYDYGLQYSFDFSPTKHLILGYSASAGSKLNTQTSYIVSQYTNDAKGNANIAVDSVRNQTDPKGKLKLPQINRFGVSFQDDGKFLVGADYSMGQWSDLSIAGVNQGLENSRTINVGAQFTPNIATIRNYLATVDYRIGALYDETYMTINNSRIKRYAVTAGLGLPLRTSGDNLSFYKINISAEIGQRGTLANGLVKENYVNLHLGFILNDRWFRKYKFD
ncbi:hypothetical protein [Mucilaginibacter sp. FT3.2]|uniref:hypothetical protein n=1 Tax=Mucilaginibacter sp. FT3.2 TaxID=2723090 RepID=UPI00161E5E80|nr:hypothetical protein [Mucilaginibacter sp. FT3.2]MBB6234426.1 hypothetical protein [Mucilaginibacter sp. FT3.2]